MSDIQSAEEVLERNKATMGDELGEVFTRLSDELTWMWWRWNEFIDLYGSEKETVGLLNATAPFFFNIIQRMFWHETILAIRCLTDERKVYGKENLTFRQLGSLIGDSELQKTIYAKVDTLIKKSVFAKDWGNRQLAHRSLELALKRPCKPLEAVSRKDIEEWLDLAADVLDEVNRHYRDSTTAFSIRPGARGAADLLFYLQRGLEASDEDN